MRSIYAGALALGLAIAAGPIPAEEMSPEQIRRHTASYARIFSAQRYVEAVGQACGPTAHRAGGIWNARNAPAVERAKELRAAMREQIAIAAGRSQAKALEDRQDEYLSKRISRVIQKIDTVPSERKQDFCAKFLKSVENGELDTVVPEATELGAGTVDQFLTNLTALSSSKCNRGALAEDFEAHGKAAEARSVTQAETTLCECMPAQVQRLRASLTEEELQERVTEPEFQARYSPKIINKCAGDQLRATFGKGCSELVAKSRKNSAAYCECMLNAVSELSDDEAAQIGKDSSEYTTLAANAKAQGTPMPDQPPGARRMSDIHAACAAK